MAKIGSWARLALVLVLFGAAGLWIAEHYRSHPEDFPWTELDLRDPVGLFTGQKIAGLTDERGRCLGLLDEARIAYRQLPDRADGENCSYGDAVTLVGDSGPQRLSYRPGDAALSCPVAAALALWERDAIQPAALRHFGEPVVAIEHFGTFACRRVNGAATGRWSEHATADAIDIAAFIFADGSRISVVEDWEGSEPETAFLKEVRDGACDVFATVLSPDYNSAHADHLHFDQAERGGIGRALCR